jgi:glucose-6-phosphate 1-dehydrogenase
MSLNSTKQLPTLLVIVGITGDLATRKLLPAINVLSSHGVLPEKFQIIGITRQSVSVNGLLDNLSKRHGISKLKWSWIKQHLVMYQLDLSQTKEYHRLEKYIHSFAKTFQSPYQTLFYLSVPPQISQPIVEHLGQTKLAKKASTKLLLEKPFGTDLKSAQDLNNHLNVHFNEKQIYRIDHYMAKEMTQNLIVFRNENSLFKRTWNNTFIERIELSLLESIGIESRVNFYEQTGALRDVIQGHLLQLAALTLMDLPPRDHWQDVPVHRLKALKQLSLTAVEGDFRAVHGQYKNYREEVANFRSVTETFVSLELSSIDPLWVGVPIILTTGKALNETKSEVTIFYRKINEGESDRLILRIQPNEGIEVQLWSKLPGYDRKLEKVNMAFTYNERKYELADAYERVLLDAIHSDHSLFTSSNEVEASWQILQPLLTKWDISDSTDLYFYKPGSQTDDIIRKHKYYRTK